MEFSKLSLEHIKTLNHFFENNSCRICDCTTGCTFMWRDHHKTEFAVEGGILYLKVIYPENEVAFSPPRGQGAGKEAYERIIDYCAETGICARICAVSETVKENLLEMFPESRAFTNRAWSDYLYVSGDIINLPGRKYAGQRNHINRFKRENTEWSFEAVTEENRLEVREFFKNYAREHIKDYPAYIEGNNKTLEVLDNFELYKLAGGALYVNGSVVGAALGETVGDTLFVHSEKADTACHGSYPMLVNQFAKMFAGDGVLYINREEDDGVEGLRTSKLSYHPASLLDKYIVELNSGNTRKTSVL